MYVYRYERVNLGLISLLRHNPLAMTTASLMRLLRL